MAEKKPKEMSIEELKLEELLESCRDDGYDVRLRELRTELNRRLQLVRIIRETK